MQGTVIRNPGRVCLLLAVSLLLFAGTVLGQEPEKAGKYVKLGVSRYARGDFDHAVKYFERALASNPQLASAYLNRGKARQAKGDLDGAISDY
ncbi:MAG TPA: tetratricopeptide repeat protein [Pyrinomonadaceae bacterium]